MNGPASVGGITVALQTNPTSLATVPVSVTVPQGQTSATFTVTSYAVATTSSVTILGTYGAGAANAPLTVTPPSVVGMSLNPTVVNGGSSSTATVSLSGPAPSGGFVVQITSSSPYATVPATVTVAAGAITGTFVIATKTVVIQTKATITVSGGGSSVGGALTINVP